MFYPILAKLISPFNEKAKYWVEGQQKVWEEVTELCSQIKGPIIWVHCASYGEFEQGLPIISALKKNLSNGSNMGDLFFPFRILTPKAPS